MNAEWQELINEGAEAFRNGAYETAETILAGALRAAERFGLDDERVGVSLGYLAALRDEQGRCDEAESLYIRSLAITEKAVGPARQMVVASLNRLADLYKDQARYRDAEPLYHRALALRERTLGPEHPDVATSLNNLEALYHLQGRFADAEPLYRRALDIREKSYVPTITR